MTCEHASAARLYDTFWVAQTLRSSACARVRGSSLDVRANRSGMTNYLPLPLLSSPAQLLGSRPFGLLSMKLRMSAGLWNACEAKS